MLLHNYPDTIFANYVLSGMQHGFPNGHTAPLTREISSVHLLLVTYNLYQTTLSPL